MTDAGLNDRFGVPAGDRFSFELNGPPRRLDQSGQGPQRGGLAGAVRADQRYDFALLDIHIDIANRPNLAIMDG